MKKKGTDRTGNILTEELIGRRVTVLHHSDPGLVGRSGTILDESMKMFLVDFDGKRKKVSKRKGRFRIDVDADGGVVPVIVSGDDILFRPADRTKRCNGRAPRVDIERKNRSESSHDDR